MHLGMVNFALVDCTNTDCSLIPVFLRGYVLTVEADESQIFRGKVRAGDPAMSLQLPGAHQGGSAMNVIVFASRKGGSGKSTLAAHLAAQAVKLFQSCLLIDTDPQGSLTLWHHLRGDSQPQLESGPGDLFQTIEDARRRGVEWVLVDTPPVASPEVNAAISAATLVIIPARPNVFDLNAIAETISVARQARKPFAVVLNAVTPKRQGEEAPSVQETRRTIAETRTPVWSGQITQRMCLALALAEGLGASEYAAETDAAAQEIAALWDAIERSAKAINGTPDRAVGTRDQAA